MAVTRDLSSPILKRHWAGLFEGACSSWCHFSYSERQLRKRGILLRNFLENVGIQNSYIERINALDFFFSQVSPTASLREWRASAEISTISSHTFLMCS